MALPATKRRKTEHAPARDDDDDDEASFASFGDDAGEDADEDPEGDADEDADGGDEAVVEGAGERDSATDDADADDASADEDDMHQDERSRAAVTPKLATPSTESRGKPDRTSQAAASAYADGRAHADGSGQGNVLKLQVDELLTQLRPRHGPREANAEAALHRLKKTIEQLADRGPFVVPDAERDLIREKLAVPFPEPRPPHNVQYQLAYSRPAVNVVGSFALKTWLRPRDQLEVDMIAVMPTALFQDKDYLNHRYFYKRAYFLACIAAGLKNAHQSEYHIRFQSMHDDRLKPVLVVSPREESGQSPPASRWQVNVIPCVSESRFAVEKLRPDRNCVRSPGGDTTGAQKPTPFYNSSLRSDMLMVEYLKLLHGASKRCEAFKDACLLGSTWLRQRNLASSASLGGFGNFEWNAFMALCLQGGGPHGKPLLRHGCSSYQLFKASLQLLGMKDFTKNPLRIGSSIDVPKLPGQPLVWDAERAHNLLYRVTDWSYRSLRSEARSTLTALGDQMDRGFDATFIWRLSEPLYRFDYIVRIPERLLLRNEHFDDHNSRQHLQTLYGVLKRGLGDRVTHISIDGNATGPWALGSARPEQGVKGTVSIGLVVNPDTVKRTVDHGPSAEHKAESAAFRKFWGEKAELRRFKDGSILESLVWSSPQDRGHSVLEQIVRFLLGRHFGAVTLDDVKLFGDDFAQLIKGGSELKPFEPLIARYQQFESDIRGLHDLPLSIRQIMPASAQLSYSSIRPPANGKGRPVPCDVTVQFEGSGRWPDHLAAIQRTKIAFLLKISEMLSQAVDGLTARLGLENEGQESLNQGFLDVTYDQDATFRLRIYHDREQTLFERQLKDKLADPKTRETAAIGLARYKRDHVKAPAQTQAIARLCTRFPALSGSIRLAKKWFACHLLCNHIPEPLVELVVARVFAHPSPFPTPCSMQTGFVRTLFFLSKWDWRSEPLVVDLSASGQLPPLDLRRMRTNFEAWRKLDPAMNRVVLFAATQLDHEGATYTDGSPAKVVAARMTQLAKAACAEMMSEHALALDPATLFSSPTRDFDFVLHLHPTCPDGRPSRRRPSGSVFKNLDLADPDLVGSDPVPAFLADLEAVYGRAVLFFHGGTERDVIAGLWSPWTERRSWKVNLAYSTLPTTAADGGAAQAGINRNAVLAEMARLGGDLVQRVEVVEH